MEINSISDLIEEPLASSLGIDPSPEVVIDELRERMIDFGKQKKSLDVRENSLKKLAGRVVDLHHDSELNGQCGNKHVNLVKMGRIVNALHLADFEIPMPQSLSTEEIKVFWQKRNPVILTHWSDLQKAHAEYKEPIPFLDHPDSIELLKKIHEAVQESFTNNDDVPIPDKWLEEKKDCFLMVRSSGAEDSEKTANAGGNMSIAYIPAIDRKAVCAAIGNVVQSYFSKTSLQNRLNAGLNPFEEDLSLGVVLQELIGEPVGGSVKSEDIPVSFVLFTNEPLFIGGEAFRVMQLSATYGHGEAVVGDVGIATDTAYILHSVANPEELFILYTNQPKRERLAPQSENPITLSSIPNPPHLVHERALSDEQLISIYRDAILVEGIFDGKPTDIEGIVRKGTVHFVQARPVNRQPMLPTHLRSTEAVLETVYADTIVPANASVVVIRDRGEVLCAHTLQEAEERYRSANPPKLVIVTERPSATSHPVVNFRGLNIPCLCIEDVQAREKILNLVNAQHLLAVCMQTATLNLWDSNKAPIEEEITPGFAVHPATLTISLPIPNLSIRPPSVQGIATIKKMIRASDWSNINKEIIHLGKRIDLLESQTTSTSASPIKLRIEALRQLERHLSNALREVIAAEAVPHLRLRALFYRKVLETLLIGSTTQNRAVGQYNLLDANAMIEDAERLIGYEKKLVFPARLLELLPLGSFSFEEWQTFLLGLENLIHRGRISNDEIVQFKTLMQQIHRAGAFPFWFTFFQPAATFREILNQIDLSDIPLLDDILRLHEKIQSMESQLSRFSDPKSFVLAWNDLKTLIQPFSSAELLGLITNSSSPIVKAIAYRTMAEAVDLLDRASKELKSSQNFADPLQKVPLFKEMLFPYYDLMNAWIRSLSSIDITSLSPTDMSVGTYLNNVQSMLASKPTTSIEQLLPSRYFSVSAAILGAKTAFYRHVPETLEDILTLLHQNALVALNISNQNLLTTDRVKRSLLPQEVQQKMELIEGGTWGRIVQRIGLQVDVNQIIIEYNVPLRNHSGHLELHYDRATREISLKGQFLGQARTRWDETAAWIQALDRPGMILQKTPLRQTEQELTFIWKVRENELEAILKEYNGMAEWSFGDYNERVIHQIWQRWSSHPNRYLLLEEFLKAPHVIREPMIMEANRNASRDPELIRIYMDDSLIWDDDNNERIQVDVLEFFSKQLQQKFCVEESLAIARKGIQKSNTRVISGSLRLFRELVLQGIAIDEAKRALSKALESPSSFLNQDVKALSHALFPNALDLVSNKLNDEIRESINYVRPIVPMITPIAAISFIAYSVYQAGPTEGMKTLMEKASVLAAQQRKSLQATVYQALRSLSRLVQSHVATKLYQMEFWRL